jgi:predicted transposase YdaD
MTSLVHDISHTRFYRDVIQKGEKRGEITGRVKQLRELLEEGSISKDLFDLKVKQLKEQLPPDSSE